MPIYGPWQDGLTHRFRVEQDTDDPTGTATVWLTGPEQPDTGLVTSPFAYGAETHNWAQPDDTHYNDAGFSNNVRDELLSGTFGGLNGFIDGPITDIPAGVQTTEWNATGSVNELGLIYRSLNSGAANASGVQYNTSVGGTYWEWNEAAADVLVEPDPSTWPEGAVAVEFEADPGFAFTYFRLDGYFAHTPADTGIAADGSVGWTCVYRPPGVTDEWPKNDSVTGALTAADVVGAPIELTDFDLIRSVPPIDFDYFDPTDPPDHLFATALGVSPLMPGGGATTASAIGTAQTEWLAGYLLFYEVEFRTAGYRFVYDIRTPAPPLRRKQRDDNAINNNRNGAVSSKQRSLRNRGYL